MVALEQARAAWEAAGRPGPGAKQLTLVPQPVKPEAERVLGCGQ